MPFEICFPTYKDLPNMACLLGFPLGLFSASPGSPNSCPWALGLLLGASLPSQSQYNTKQPLLTLYSQDSRTWQKPLPLTKWHRGQIHPQTSV